MTSPLLQSMTQTPATDGDIANVVELTNQKGCSIVVMDVGATWLSCQLALTLDQTREVILGIATMEQFYEQQAYLGASVGRYANRINNGHFSIGSEEYQLSINQAGNTLHGGEVGFDKRRWDIVEQSSNSVTMGLNSLDGDQGFPGNLAASVCYTLTEENRVEIVYRAKCDKPCPVNLTNHAYFNLQGADSGENCLSHTLQLEADYFLPVSDVGIPFSSKSMVDVTKSVKNTGFDFRTPKQVAKHFMLDDEQQNSQGYDHSYLLAESKSLNHPVASLVSPDKKVTMKVLTDKPAIQLYTGNFLAGTPRRQGGVYENYAGIALETQYLPDSPNHPEWKHSNSILEPGKDYCFTTAYQFEMN